MLMIDELPFVLKKVLIDQNLTKNQILFQQGELAQGIFWVKSGRVKLVSFTEQQMITHYSVNAGESFAETALYYDTYPCTAIAEIPSQVTLIPKRIFLAALRQSPPLSEQYLAHLTHRLASVKQLLVVRSIRSARERLLHYFFLKRQPGELTVSLPQSLRDLASELGISPEALSRTFAQLESEGVLRRKKGSVTFAEESLDV